MEEKNQEINEEAVENGNFNDNLHGENLTDRVKVLSPGMTVVKRFFRSKLSIFGLAVLIFLFAFSFIGPLFSPWSANGGTVKDTSSPSYNYTYNTIAYTGPDGETYYAYNVVIDEYGNYSSLDGISGKHWLGTDVDGNDVLTRLMFGGRVSLTIGFIVIILETILGCILGGLFRLGL